MPEHTQKRTPRRTAAAVAAAGLTALLCAAPLAAPAVADTAADKGARPATPDRASVQRFFDRRIPELLKEQHVPGAAITVVDTEGTVFTGDYGYADVERGKPVAADTTAFQTASVAKSFTAVAVMQLVEDGKLDLDTNVNAYLPAAAELPDTYPGEPVTLHHLLTHTAGFAEHTRGMTVPTAADLLPLGEQVVEYRPDRIRPPGAFVGYSNYGFDLAGYIVEVVAEQSFESYLAENVFAPLGMEHSAFIQPGDARRSMSGPVAYDSELEPIAPTNNHGAPSGVANATVTDMGRFMRTLLNGGTLDGTRILSEQSAETMLGRRFTLRAGMPGPGYGTWEGPGDGPRSTGHGGDEYGAHTEYVLVPSRGLGMYVAVNGDGTAADPFGDVRSLVVEEFLAEFADVRPYAVPKPEPTSESVPGAKPVATSGAKPGAASGARSSAKSGGADRVALEHLTGQYVSSRMEEGEPAKLFRTVMDRMTVTAPGDGALHTDSLIFGREVWTRGADGVFVSSDGTDRVGFVERGGEVVALTFDSNPTQAYMAMRWYTTPTVLLGIAAAALLVLLSTLAWPVSALTRRLRGRTAPQRGPVTRASGRPSGAGPALARGTAGATVLLCLAGMAAFGYGLADMSVFETAPLLITAPWTLAAILAAAVLVCASTAWFRTWWTPLTRTHYTAVAMAAAALITIALHYGLIWTP